MVIPAVLVVLVAMEVVMKALHLVVHVRHGIVIPVSAKTIAHPGKYVVTAVARILKQIPVVVNVRKLHQINAVV